MDFQMISYREIVNGLIELKLDRHIPIIAHISRDMCRKVKGGASSVLGAILAVVDNAMLPSFTLRTLIIPENGPENNAIEYGSGRESNFNAEIFTEQMPVDESDDQVVEVLRQYPQARRSHHPALSFAALGMNAAMESQTIENPYLPIQALLDDDGWVVLMDADQTKNFSIHLAEFLAGRQQFIRWALTSSGVFECPHFPGCPDGFKKLQFHIEHLKNYVNISNISCQSYPLKELIDIAVQLIKNDPYALLCNRLNCDCCNAVRKAIAAQPS